MKETISHEHESRKLEICNSKENKEKGVSRSITSAVHIAEEIKMKSGRHPLGLVTKALLRKFQRYAGTKNKISVDEIKLSQDSKGGPFFEKLGHGKQEI